MTGWQYDLCCGNSDVEVSEKLDSIGFCKKDTCEFKGYPSPGFCIRSPRLACLATTRVDLNGTMESREESIMVSNQCCYHRTSDELIENSISAGSMQRESGSIDNMIRHFTSDLKPFYECCKRTLPGEPFCGFYKKHRPTIIGKYWPRNILINRGDPHLQTVDGVSYPFMGLGVYMMLITDDSSSIGGQTELQASMRRVGNGTVFSGIAVKHGNTLLEVYVDKIAKVKLVINNFEKTLGENVREYILANVAVEERDDLKSVRFQFLGNMLIVEVYVIQNFLNLKISVPPSFKFQMRGLLGYYDGDPDNDFQTPEGVIVTNTTDYAYLHEAFGTSWVVDPDEWLFKQRDIVSSIENDIAEGSPFEPIYEPLFTNEQLQLEANEVCKGDSACLLDIALTGNISISEAFVQFESQINAAHFWNEVFRLTEMSFFIKTAQPADESDDLTEKWTFAVSLCVMTLFLLLLLVMVFRKCLNNGWLIFTRGVKVGVVVDQNQGGEDHFPHQEIRALFWIDERDETPYLR
ncbi:sushi domain-containing protein 2-like [Symsagittifera roscoffensis]|uniref:sushi domain-containing protein 2-like n=1 Tax=Symsagittifera roscoffensis TaxID=84072 RepID=UPI00307C169D